MSRYVSLVEMKERYTRIRMTELAHVRQCPACGICTLTIDEYQRGELEAHGWVEGGLCLLCQPTGTAGRLGADAWGVA